jgi:hypothetical protein
MSDARTTNLLGAAVTALNDELEAATTSAAEHGAAFPAALVSVHWTPGLSIEQLRRVLGISHSGTVRLLDRLEREGAVERPSRHPAVPVVAAVGVAVGLVSGILGLGGPMLSVPLLLALGVGVLEALAAAQVQSIVIASVGTIGYALHGSVDWPLVGLIGLPELAGVIVGWRIARALPTRTLRGILIAVLLLLAPYLALR